MAKAWRNEAAAKINARRKAGSKEASARAQKNQRMFIARIFPVKASGNWLLDGLLNKLYYMLGMEPAPSYELPIKRANAQVAAKQVVDTVNNEEGFISRFVNKAKAWFKGK